MKITQDLSESRISRPWRVSWQDIHKGQRRRWFPSKADAEAFAQTLPKDEASNDIELASLNRRDKVDLLSAFELAKTHGFNIREAAEYYQRFVEENQPVRLSTAIKEMLGQMKKMGRRRKTINALRSTLNSFCSMNNDKFVGEVSRQDILDYIFTGQVGTATHLHRHSRIRRFLNWAKRRKFIKVNPCLDIYRDEDIGELEAREIHSLNANEVEQLFNAALKHDKGLIPFLTLATFCGIRPGEITGEGGKPPITWENIIFDEDHALVRVPSKSSKTKETRHVAIAPNAVAWLKLGGELGHIKNLRKRRVLNALEANVQLSQDVLRHTFGTMHYRLHRDAALLKEEMGHSENSKTLKNHYLSGEITLSVARKFWEITPDPSHSALIQSAA